MYLLWSLKIHFPNSHWEFPLLPLVWVDSWTKEQYVGDSDGFSRLRAVSSLDSALVLVISTKELVKMSSHIWPCGRAGGQLGQGVGMMRRAVWAVAWIKDIRRLRTKPKVEQKQEQTHPSPELSWPIHSTLSLSKAHCWLSASHNGHLLFSP